MTRTEREAEAYADCAEWMRQALRLRDDFASLGLQPPAPLARMLDAYTEPAPAALSGQHPCPTCGAAAGEPCRPTTAPVDPRPQRHIGIRICEAPPTK